MTALSLLAELRALVAQHPDPDVPTHDEALAVYQVVARWQRGGFQGIPTESPTVWMCACPPGQNECLRGLQLCEICGIARPEAP